MRFLLDTHCWLWWNIEPERLGPEAYDAIADGANDIVLSTASVWEIAIKHALGRLTLPSEPKHYIPERLASNQIASIPITQAHVLFVSELPHHHRDPFDRLLVAQSRLEKFTLITADDSLRKYDVELLWASRASRRG